MWISDKQKLAMEIVDKLVKEFGVERWFVKSELPKITQHSVDALVSKGYFEVLNFNETGIVYYRRLKELED